jgi:oligosaccharide repeat unit polymerase
VPLSTTTTILLSTVLVCMIYMGIKQSKSLNQEKNIPYFKSSNTIFIFTIALWFLQFIHFHSIPLVSSLLGISVDYQEFGIPTLKVFIYSFSLFICTFFFHLFLVHKKNKHLWFSIIIAFQPLLGMSRGPFLIGLIQLFLVYCIYNELIKKITSFLRKINLKKLFLLTLFIASILGLIYLFGFLGGLRGASTDASRSNTSSFESNTNYTGNLMRPTSNFESIGIPEEFLWVYVYITSPLSNLEYTFQKYQPKYDLQGFILNEFFYDFISKRVNEVFGTEGKESFLVVNYLTVSTVFAGSYQFLGYLGVMIMCIFLLVFPLLYLKLISGIKSSFYLTSLSAISTLYMFMFFENLIVFSGFSLQLIYPFLFNLFIRKSTIRRQSKLPVR